MANEFIQSELKDGVLVITLDDSGTRNAIGQEMSREINDELDRFEDDPDYRVLLLTGKDPAFCSGANVRGFARGIAERERAAQAPQEHEKEKSLRPWGELDYRYRRGPGLDGAGGVFLPIRLHNLQKPSVAAVNGYAMGLGCGLALACDIRVASEKAGFSEAFIRNGLIPADGSCWQLPRMIGLSNTFLMQYTGDIVSGEEAHRWGMVSKVVPHDQLMETAMELATRLARGPTFSMSLIKYLIQKSTFLEMPESIELAQPAQDMARNSEDHKEGVRAFIEKRKPVFKGR